MFWRFGGYANISTLDTILDKPDVTVEDLLEESDLIQELKQQNSKLIEFLRDEPVLKKLLDYVVADRPSDERGEEDKEEDEKAKGSISFFSKGKGRSSSKSSSKSEQDGDTDGQKKEEQVKKYSYVACEVLSSEVWSITEALMEQQDHLREFWTYMRRPAPLDPLQAGYFTKVNEALLDKKTEDMLAFFKSLDGIIPAMLQHVDCPMVMDLLLKIISLEKHDGGQGIVDWLQRQNLIPTLLSFLSPEHNSATQTSAGDFLKAIITISANATTQDQSVIGPNELTRELVSEKCIDQLISDMLQGGNPLTVGVGIIIEVIRKNNSDYDLDSQVGPEPKTSDPIYLGSLLRQFADHVPQFMELIRAPASKKAPLKTAFGGSVEPLGFDRFKTCELMAELLHCSNMGLLNERGAEEDVRKRDAERYRLKAEGKLATPKAPASPSQVGDSHDEFGSSVDSQGFHHAKLEGSDDEKSANDQAGHASVDEDGFEQVAKPSAVEDLPDEVTFDELTEKVEDMPSLTKIEKRDPTAPENRSSTGMPAPLKTSTQTAPHFDPPPQTAGDSPTSAGVTERLGSMEVDEDTVMTELGEDSRSPADADDGPSELEKELAKAERPAPLFSAKPAQPEGDNWDQEREAGIDQSVTTIHGGDQAPVVQEGEVKEYETEEDGSPVVGDWLKIQFVEHQVVPTILDFFFRFPWNNFLHNVVYDVVQQVFNGNLDRGYNRTLAFDLFTNIPLEDGQTADSLGLRSDKDITDRILEGQKASDESQGNKGMRLGYMGHLTLIAEEVCKFGNRQPPEALDPTVHERVNREEWIQYVDGTLTETRDKDNAVLGGVRPENAMGVRQMGGMGIGGGGFTTNTTNTLANAGIGGGVSTQDALAMSEGTVGQSFEINSGTMLSGFGDADDDDDEMDESGEGREGDRRGSSGSAHLSDDEQAAASSSQHPSIPPPLNIAPSGARKKLAARLAARKQEAEAAAQGDPDAIDHAAIETASELPEEPHEITALSPYPSGSATHGVDQGLQITGLRGLQPGASRFSSLFESGDSSDSSVDDDSSDDTDEDEAGRNEKSSKLEGDCENLALADSSSSARQRPKVLNRRPSTKEAKERQSLDDDDDDDDDDEDYGVEMKRTNSGLRHPSIGGEASPFTNPANEEEESSDDSVDVRPTRRSSASTVPS